MTTMMTTMTITTEDIMPGKIPAVTGLEVTATTGLQIRGLRAVAIMETTQAAITTMAAVTVMAATEPE